MAKQYDAKYRQNKWFANIKAQVKTKEQFNGEMKEFLKKRAKSSDGKLGPARFTPEQVEEINRQKEQLEKDKKKWGIK